MKKMLIEEHISALVMGVMVLLAFINIISRIFSGFSFAFTEELIVYLFVVTTMFSTAACAYRRTHMSLTLISDMFKGWGQIFFMITSSVASCILFGLLAWQSFELMQREMKYGYLTAVLQIPQWIFTLSMVLGSILYIVRVAQVFVEDYKALQAKMKEKKPEGASEEVK
jgi:TRAP-type C4-dicarboxylate transport system permease small subunit